MEHLVLYDGVCGLCNRSVKSILKADSAERFLFATIQSATGGRLLARYGLAAAEPDSLILIVNYGQLTERCLRKSAASLFIAAQLGGWWSVLRVAELLPRPALDRLYDTVARNRYGWFGKLESCPLPDNRYRHRFINE